MSEEHKQFRELRERIWPLFMFQIETASFDSEGEDWPWIYYCLYRRTKKRSLFVGVIDVTIFHFQHNVIRQRISQVLILPHYQRKGFCQLLLHQVYADLLRDKRSIQICVEDPNEDFSCVRDLVECQLIVRGKFFEWYAPGKKVQKLEELAAFELTPEQVPCIKRYLKLPKSQVLRVHDIILYSVLDPDNREHEAFFKRRFIERTKKLEEPKYKQKVPFINFDGKQSKIDVNLITQTQNKVLQQGDYYEKLYDYTMSFYKQVAAKLNQQQV